MDVSDDRQPPPRPPSRPPGRRGPARSGRRPTGSPAGGRRPPPPSRARPSRPGPSRPRPGSRQPDQRRTIVILSVLSALVVTVGVTAFALSAGPNGRPGGGPAATTTVPGTGTTVAAAGLATYRDDVTGFSLKYPRTWQRAAIPADGPLRLVLQAGGLNGVSVRVSRTEVPTTTENLANIKAVTDGIVGSNATAKVLDQRQVSLNGMPGYYYLYTFTDEETGAEGAHGHYFLFKGRKMHHLIFQAIPQEGFRELAAVFDQMAESFQSDPDLAPAPEVTTIPASTAPPG